MIFFKANEVTNLIVKQTEKITECLKIIKYIMEGYLDKNLMDSASRFIKAKGILKDIEYLRDQIVDHLYKGALIPVLREDIFSLVNDLNILSMNAIECGSMFLDQQPSIPGNLRKDLSKMIHYATGITEPLDNCITGCIKGIHKKNVIRKHSQKVRKSFIEVCAIKSDLIREISSLPEDQVNKAQIYQCLDCLKAISEKAVNITENIETILIKFF